LAKPGPKGTNNIIKMNKGTYQPCRNKEEVREEVGDNSDLVCPDWLGGRAKKIWSEKLEIYNKSGLNVSGSGHALAQYCALEASIIGFYERNEAPSMAMINAHRIWASEFFDTPASGHVAKPSGKKSSSKKQGFASL
jgi:hypothetical protein